MSAVLKRVDTRKIAAGNGARMKDRSKREQQDRSYRIHKKIYIAS